MLRSFRCALLVVALGHMLMGCARSDAEGRQREGEGGGPGEGEGSGGRAGGGGTIPGGSGGDVGSGGASGGGPGGSASDGGSDSAGGSPSTGGVSSGGGASTGGVLDGGGFGGELVTTGGTDSGGTDSGGRNSGGTNSGGDSAGGTAGVGGAPPVSGCTSFVDRSAPAASRHVQWGFGFAASDDRCLMVAVGQSLTFEGNFGSHPLGPGDGDTPHPFATFQETAGVATVHFPNVGTFGFECGNHATMMGAVRVVEP